MVNKILIPAILTRYAPLKDKSWSVSLNLNEPNAEQKVLIDRLFQQPVYVLIKEGQITKEETSLIDSLEAQEHKIKTKSQRLRNTMYRVWEAKFKDKMTDKEFYDSEMEKVINHYKNKLD
jgi:hypothetical protein